VSAPLRQIDVSWLNSTGHFVASLLNAIAEGFVVGFLFLLLVVLMRLLVRRVWVADVLAAVLAALSGGVDYSHPAHFALTATTVALAVYGTYGCFADLACWRGWQPGA
jgi:general stress protein CsbA